MNKIKQLKIQLERARHRFEVLEEKLEAQITKAEAEEIVRKFPVGTRVVCLPFLNGMRDTHGVVEIFREEDNLPERIALHRMPSVGEAVIRVVGKDGKTKATVLRFMDVGDVRKEKTYDHTRNV